MSEHTPNQGSEQKKGRRISRMLVCVMILAIAFGAMHGLRGMKKEPPKAEPQAPSLTVQLQLVHFTNVTVNLRANGIARSLRYVDLSAEVAGTVVKTGGELKAGDRVKEGALLFQLDPRDYRAALDEAGAQKLQLEATRSRLLAQQTSDEKQLTLMTRNSELAASELNRTLQLFENEKIGTASDVERAEQSLNMAKNQLIAVEQALSVYPAQIAEVDSQLKAAEARLRRAQLNVDRCEVRAPFNARITSSMIEEGEFLNPGQPVLSLADDQTLEILAPIDSTDLRKWLQFKETTDRGNWFAPVEPVAVLIEWTESSESIQWTGTLHRVESFDATTRMAKVAVRVNGTDHQQFPLVDGMFCRLTIPGRTLNRVVKLPGSAVTFDQNVYTSVNGKLKTMPVRVLRTEGEQVLIGSGLDAGQLVVTTRLIAPLEGIHLNPQSD